MSVILYHYSHFLCHGPLELMKAMVTTFRSQKDMMIIALVCWTHVLILQQLLAL